MAPLFLRNCPPYADQAHWVRRSSEARIKRQRPVFLLSSHHDDRDYRTRTEGARAKRRGWVHHCGRRRRDLPDPARVRQRLTGRLAVVFLDRLCCRFSDDDRRQSRRLFFRVDGDRRHPLSERTACAAFFPAAAATTLAASAWTPAGTAPPPDPFSHSCAIDCRGRGLWWAAQVSSLCLSPREKLGNWDVFLQFLYHVPYGADDPLYEKDIGFYLFLLPAYILIKNWMLLTLVPERALRSNDLLGAR